MSGVADWPDAQGLDQLVTEAVAQAGVDEKAAKYEATTIRDLCKLAEHHAGTSKVVALFKAHGVGKLAEANATQLDALRAAVLELVP